jgi:hypothetical protein
MTTALTLFAALIAFMFLATMTAAIVKAAEEKSEARETARQRTSALH